MNSPNPIKTFWLFLLLLVWPEIAFSETIHVAVAANFKKPFLELSTIFENQTKHHLLISSGSTGKLYAQIINGAPFQIFLSADQHRPRLLAEAGLADPNSQFTYALGRLALWTPNSGGKTIDREYLLSNQPARVALSNPKVAPYGQGAKQVMKAIGVWRSYQGRMAFGENVGQTLAFVNSGSVEVGFVALSQVLPLNPDLEQIWIIPQNLYTPLRQDVTLLKNGYSSPGTKALLAFLQAPTTMKIIKKIGYAVP
jgi:molybdate transport system substrate-binding protein